MQATVVRINAAEIQDWSSFHAVFQQVFGFPDFYGHNLDAWNRLHDLLRRARRRTQPRFCKSRGGTLLLRLDQADEFQKRCPAQYAAFLDCSAFVNRRRVEVGEAPILALLLV
jgi:hypothetical protein